MKTKNISSLTQLRQTNNCYLSDDSLSQSQITGWAVAQTCCTLAQTCCIRNGLSVGKVGISTTPGSKTPKPIDTKLVISNYVCDLTLTSKHGSNRPTCVVWAHA